MKGSKRRIGGMGMFKKVGIILLLASAVCGFSLSASADVLVSQADNWSYSGMTIDLYSDWSNAGYNSFDWSSATWNSGKAAFGNSNPANGIMNTDWAANTDLALMKSITVSGIASNVVLNVASDNGFILFINGVQVAKEMAEGFTSIWEYTYNLNPSNLVNGSNVIQVLAEDHGGATYFDMQLTADVKPVPLPPSALLILPGLLGMYATRKRLKK